MGIAPSLLFGTVMHKRLFPKVNAFQYGIYYLAFPLSQLKSLPIAVNRFAPLCFLEKDHGYDDGTSSEAWVRDILNQFTMTEADGEVTLVCMPRVIGYVFNPVSFWLCHDKDGNLRAVVCEVHNTFGEKHSYLCAHPDHRPIDKRDVLKGEKVFHVSPFLEREGHYTFRFDTSPEAMTIWINYLNAEGELQLVTSLEGTLKPMTKSNLRKAFWGYPLITLKAITLIHWQAIKLIAKGINYIPRPKQKQERLSATENLTKL